MKTILKSLLALMLVFSAGKTMAHEKSEWKEMKEFHAVMSKTFHSSEDNNLQPLKDMAEDLAKKATLWRNSTPPADWDAKKVAPVLAKLEDKCKAIAVAVKAKKSDEELKKMIAEAHDVFHEIVEKCMPHDEGHKH